MATTTSEPRVKAGQDFQFRVTVTAESVTGDSGVVTDVPVDVMATLPSGATMLPFEPPKGTTYDPATGRWMIGSLADGKSVTLKLKVITTRATVGDAGLTATVHTPAGVTDLDPGDNSATTTVSIEAR